MKVLFLLGPTASGKSQIALDLAKKFGGEIVNCDSVQIYEGLDIGSAKPTKEEMAEVPHHLFSFVKKGQAYTAGDYEKDAIKTLKQFKSRLAIVTGGTGFYFMALENGLYEGEKTSETIKKRVREDLEANGLQALYEKLQKADPHYAEKISNNDSYRITRAMEVVLEGKKPSDLKANFSSRPFPFPLLKIGLNINRDILRLYVAERVRAMLAKGWKKEVSELIEEGYAEWPALNSVGYKEIKESLESNISEEELVKKITTKTMQLAKKQRTWFQRDASIFWFDSLRQREEIEDKVANYMGDKND